MSTTKKKAGSINEFLWFCAGVDRDALRACPSDYGKYTGIGGTILATALMASLSGGYALFVIFKSTVSALFFGIFWGLLIFNLDRFIVSTMYSDGKATISFGEFFSALPRIIIAVILAVVISNPLELKIFEKEIDYEIEQLKNAKASDSKLISLQNELDQLYANRTAIDNGKAAVRKSSTADYNTMIGGKIDDASQEIEEARKSIAHYDGLIRSSNSQIYKLQRDESKDNSAEIKRLQNNRYSYTSTRNSLNSKVERLIAEKRGYENGVQTEMNNEIAQFDNRSAENDRQIKLKEQEITAYKSKIGSVADNYDGYAARLEAFGNVRASKKVVDIAAWIIMALFMVIEIAPTIFKLMIPSGPYDDLLRAEKHRIKKLSDKTIAEVDDDVNTAIKISTASNLKKLALENANNEKLLEAISDAQMEIMDKALTKWKEDQLLKAESDPASFITTT